MVAGHALGPGQSESSCSGERDGGRGRGSAWVGGGTWCTKQHADGMSSTAGHAAVQAWHTAAWDTPAAATTCQSSQPLPP